MDVTVWPISTPPSQPAILRLNPTDNLLNIRKELEKYSIINNTLSFSKKISEKNNESDEFVEILREDEGNCLLSEIIDERQNILYLTNNLNSNSRIDWKILNKKYKLDYGRTMSFDGIKRANKRAFTMIDCKMFEIGEIGAEGCRKGTIEFESEEDWMMKTNLFFTRDINVENFVKLGLSVENKNFNDDIESTYQYTELGKVSLKFNEYLKPTEEFIRTVEDTIESKDAEKFKQIAEEFGQFITAEVILGGRAYFKISPTLDDTKVGNDTSTTCYKCRLLGGMHFDDNDFDEKAWIESLKDYKDWDCIEFRNPISIFQLLPDDIRKQMIFSLGKRIHYSNVEDFNYRLSERGKPEICELKNMPQNILDIILNKEADCNIFATVIDMEEVKNDIFSWQMHCPLNGKPSLIIHCVQKRFRIRECKLKISWMVIGYDINSNFVFSDFNNIQLKVLRNDFNTNNQMIDTRLLNFEYSKVPPCIGIPVLNRLDLSNNSSIIVGHHFYNAQEDGRIGLCTFSYCLKNNRYVNLPNHTFYTLIISNYPISNAYGLISFNQSRFFRNPYINFTQSSLYPKFISLYSTKKSSCGPIFLKQNNKQIKIKYINCKCKTCFICKNKSLKVSENNLECAFFDPQISNNALTSSPVFNSCNTSSSSTAVNSLASTRSSRDFTSMITLPSISNITPTINRQVIQQLKLNHGLFLDGYNIQSSKQAIFTEDGELNISLYRKQPIVYTNINDQTPTNFKGDLHSSDACIDFLVAEITYKGDKLLESFSKSMDDDEKLYELYGHFVARKISVGGKLFIKGFSSATQTQIEILKFYLFCSYNSAKYSTEIPLLSNLFPLNLLPKMETLDGEEINTHEKLEKWMNNLYQEKSVVIISYDNLVPISQLRRPNTLSVDDFETFKQPGIANFKEKFDLEEWVGDAVHDNLMSLAKNFHLFRGLKINKNCEIGISDKNAINFTEIPTITLSDKSYLNIIEPSTKLEVILISNNIFSLNDLESFPFIKCDNIKGYGDYIHVIIKCEKYEILLNRENIKPTKEFERAIEKAIDSMNPFKALQDIFNEYGHLFPQRIILGRSLKNISPNANANKINLKSPISESLDKLNISYLLTQKGKLVVNNDISNWIQNTNNNLEIIEFDDIIPFYKILDIEQQTKIDDILKNNYKIIMIGITDLKDLDNNIVGHYKRINLESSLEDENYEIYGSIISNNNSKLEEFYVNFGLYDLNGFFAMIKRLSKTNVNITECHVLWMIIGKPSKLSVFSPNNREVQANRIEESITIQPNQSIYTIKTPTLLLGHVILVNAYYPSTNCEPYNIKLIEWSDNSINIKIIKSTCIESNSNIVSDGFSENSTKQDSNISFKKTFLKQKKTQSDENLTNIEAADINIDLHICILSTDYKSLRVDNVEMECSLNSIGYVAAKENWIEK